jgi:HlyD family secretion protein
MKAEATDQMDREIGKRDFMAPRSLGWRLAFALGATFLAALSCNETSNKNFLGSAVVESRTYAVATTAQGQIIALYKDEGQTVGNGELMAVIDTVPLTLQRQEALSSIAEVGTTIASQMAQAKSVESDVSGAEREFRRTEQLLKQGATTEQHRDNQGTQLQSSRLKLQAAQRSIGSLGEREKGLKIRIKQLDDQLARCSVKAPAKGIVLTRYRNTGEIVGPGNPIFEVGSFDTLYADFFIPQPMLATVTYGQTVRIRVDYGDKRMNETEKLIPARITWIGSEAEFSPKNIQTRQSRNELVFRIRATIPNLDGVLKRGLPVEVWR